MLWLIPYHAPSNKYSFVIWFWTWCFYINYLLTFYWFHLIYLWLQEWFDLLCEIFQQLLLGSFVGWVLLRVDFPLWIPQGHELFLSALCLLLLVIQHLHLNSIVDDFLFFADVAEFHQTIGRKLWRRLVFRRLMCYLNAFKINQGFTLQHKFLAAFVFCWGHAYPSFLLLTWIVFLQLQVSFWWLAYEEPELLLFIWFRCNFV